MADVSRCAGLLPLMSSRPSRSPRARRVRSKRGMGAGARSGLTPARAPLGRYGRTRDIMRTEFKTFEETLPYLAEEERAVFPHPTAEGGLPVGWVIRWSAPYSGFSDMEAWEVFLIERVAEPSADEDARDGKRDGERDGAGGWGMVFHIQYAGRPKMGKTIPWSYEAATMSELYAAATYEADKGVRWSQALLRDYILTRYNHDDPTEAAEATLVGLGGPITVFPSSLG